MEDRHIIWSNENLDLDDWREDLQEQYPDCSEDELYRIMCETNADYQGRKGAATPNFSTG